MEKEPNIAAILKEKPKGTKLWSPMHGNCEFLSIVGKAKPIQVLSKSGTHYFREDGKYDEYGEVCLFPSKQMQDWSKFAWKKGDVLVCKSDSPYTYTFFDHFTNDEYTEFYGKFHYSHEYCKDYGNTSGKTAIYEKISDELADKIISSLENIFGGKLNLETLEIEHPKPEFKDGDIVVAEGDNLEKKIFIFRYKMRDSYSDERIYRSHISINSDGTLFHKLMFYLIEDVTYRLATDSEKQQLFDAIAKENKRWNPENKTIEDLPKKCELEPFQKVLVRDRYTDEWMAGFFSHYIESSKDFVCTSGSWRQCIPYNDKTKHLLGTTDDWKGGEG